jgi:hypothetical protein
MKTEAQINMGREIQLIPNFSEYSSYKGGKQTGAASGTGGIAYTIFHSPSSAVKQTLVSVNTTVAQRQTEKSPQ